MKIQMISTVVGPTGPHLFSHMAKLSREWGAEWQSTKLIHLEGQFAAMMKVSVEEANEATLKTCLAEAFPELHFTHLRLHDSKVADSSTDDNQAFREIRLEFDCQDRPGLIRELHQALIGLGVAVTQMESHRMPVISLGCAVFNASLRLILPPRLALDTLITALEAVEPNARVHQPN